MGGTKDSPSLSSDVEQPVQHRPQGFSDSFPEAENPETQRLQSLSDITGEVETRAEADKILAQAEKTLRQARTILTQSQLTQVQSQMIRVQIEEKLAQAEEKLAQAEEKLAQAEEKLAQAEEKLAQAEEIPDQTEEEQDDCDNQKSQDEVGILKQIWRKIKDLINKLKKFFRRRG
uniref:WD repeat-containing protein 87-like n=1 Tax=Myodes glareolus TaxID=447135 RepID=UPI00201FC83F|nr:WD repeat-containing protein 87-like [Myodes glareolus]XP_048292305.1 WD repeat-containing protein 87-like [Myodes glareolus]